MADVARQSAVSTVRPRVAVVDKNPIVRLGLEDLIGKDRRFDMIGVVGTGHEFLKLVGERPIDIGVVGWSLPDQTGGDVLAELKRRKSTTYVIIYTGEASTGVLRQAISLGARAFVSKNEEPAEILDAIATVAHGRFSWPYVDVQALAKSPLDAITSRERELLEALAKGLTNSQIACRLGITKNTVKYHLKNLFDKLEVSNRTMAISLLLSESRDRR